jgi:hypothetical protein
MDITSAFSIVPLPDGRHSVRSEVHGETFHPQVGPEVEARCVYFNPMRIEQRIANSVGSFHLWDIGLGSAGNAINLIREHAHIQGDIVLHSFDATLEPLNFALGQSDLLGYMRGFESQIEQLIQEKVSLFQWGKLNVSWHLHLGDLRNGYPGDSILNHGPEAVLYDPYSPAKNPELWSLKAFNRVREKLVSPCTLATYSRSTSVRVAMLCAGFFVGVGGEVGEKEETTVAATHPGLVESLLDDVWLKKVMNSTNAEPITQIPHNRSFVQQSTWSKLIQHPQFEKYSFASELPVRH